MLVYAQKPDATAVASMNIWNKKMKRYVNSGSKAIYTFKENENGLELLFDVSNTNGAENTLPYKWKYDPKNEKALINELSLKYDIDFKADGKIKDAIFLAMKKEAERLTEENYKKLQMQIKYSQLAQAENKEIKRIIAYVTSLTTSAIICERMGIPYNANRVKQRIDQYLRFFDTNQSIVGFGALSNDIAKDSFYGWAESQ